MRIEHNGNQFPCMGISENLGTLVLSGVTGVASLPSGIIRLVTEMNNEPLVLREINTTDYTFAYLDGEVLTFTNSERITTEPTEPTPPQPTETEKLRADVDYLAMETGVSL